MSNQPIEEKWKEEFDKEFGTVSWMTDYDDCENANSQIKSFIENLLEQERKRMSDIERVLERHISWKPTEGHGSEEELGFQKGLMAEAKLIKKEILAIIHPAVEEMPQMKGTLEALDDTHTVKEEKLGCGCVKNTCKCDPMRHWPPVCCDKCPSLPKEEPTTPEKKRCKYCGTDYTDPKYCSVFGRSADEHKWI